MYVAILQYGGFCRQGIVNVAGTVKVICVPSVEDAVSLLFPKYTVSFVLVKFFPVIVTCVPAGPDAGAIEVILGRSFV